MQLTNSDFLDLLKEMTPSFLLLALFEDAEFRDVMGVFIGHQITLGSRKIDRDAFLLAAQEAYTNAGKAVTVRDVEENCVEVRAVDADHLELELRLGSEELLLPGFLGLHPGASVRETAFDKICEEAALDKASYTTWRQHISERTLTFDEIQTLDELLASTPQSVRNRLAHLRMKNIPPRLFVPDAVTYYERILGSGVAENLTSFAEQVVNPTVERLLSWRRREGARQALALGGHWKILASSALATLPAEEFSELLAWARDYGDPISKVVAVELALQRDEDVLTNTAVVGEIARAVAALNPEDPAGVLNLLSAAFVLTEAEISRTGVLAQWPPFQRRAASLAHAVVLAQVLPDDLDHARFAAWVQEQAVEGFYLQSLVDLRLEPRWFPDNISSVALKHELIGRLRGAAERSGDKLPRQLRGTFFDPEDHGSVAELFRIPQCRLAGPLEGTLDAAMPLSNGELLDAFDESLERERFEPQTLAALINLQSMFCLDSGRIDRAVGLIKEKGYRFERADDDQEWMSVIKGLAEVAASSRNVELAQTVRLMCRAKRTEPGVEPRFFWEFIIALTAAASHEEFTPWAEFLANWALELALQLADKREADAFVRTLEHTLQITPLLRIKAGPALAASTAFLAAEGARFVG